MQNRRSGFSLLEVGIVVVTVGLVAGAVLTSQELTRRSELRGVVTDATTYAIAMKQFQDKYATLPGDMPNATKFWGRADNTNLGAATIDLTSNCTSTLTAVNLQHPKATCNGNGDGIIQDASGENFRVWQQLAAGDYLKTAYTGLPANPVGGAVSKSIPGTNVPDTKLRDSGFTIASNASLATNNVIDGGANAVFFDGDYNNTMVFGAPWPGDYTIGPSLKTQEAREIDEKSDDMNPATGNIRSVKNGSAVTPNCVITGSNGFKYNEGNTDFACALIFMGSYQRKISY